MSSSHSAVMFVLSSLFLVAILTAELFWLIKIKGKKLFSESLVFVDKSGSVQGGNANTGLFPLAALLA